MKQDFAMIQQDLLFQIQTGLSQILKNMESQNHLMEIILLITLMSIYEIRYQNFF
jgi:hypothetical protein